jgi:DNA transposition AAA+ family ATPase
MEQERISNALAKVEELKINQGLSQERAGKLIGVSGAVLSQLTSGKYKGDVDRMIKIIEDYFSVKEGFDDTYHEVDYAETSISSKVYDTIKLCHIKGGLAIFSGDAGIGKTKAAKKYVADNPTNSIYIALNPCLTSIKAILKILASKIGARPERSLDDMWLSIREKLSDGMVIIFDEAQHLPYKPIETIRAFADSFSEDGQTLGIVFIGNPETVRRLGAKQKAEFAQISNRTKQKLVYSTKQIKREDIELLFPILANKNMTAEIDFLWGIAQTEQGLRGTVNLFGNAYDNNDYTLKGLAAMAKHMELDLSGLDIRQIKKGAA